MKWLQYLQGVGAGNRRSVDKAVLRKLKPSMVFDVGANRGQYLQLALAQATTVHAFEPSSVAFAALTQRFSSRPNVVLNRLALGREATERELYFDVPGSELSSLYQREITHHGHQLNQNEVVQVETLDHYCEQHQIERIDLLKLDAEGHELEILKGAARLLERKQIRAVSFEFGGCNVDSRTFLRDFFYFFKTQGMGLSRVTALGRLHTIPQYDESLEQFRTTCFVATK